MHERPETGWIALVPVDASNESKFSRQHGPIIRFATREVILGLVDILQDSGHLPIALMLARGWIHVPPLIPMGRATLVTKLAATLSRRDSCARCHTASSSVRAERSRPTPNWTRPC